jgi:hypothetical protein
VVQLTYRCNEGPAVHSTKHTQLTAWNAHHKAKHLRHSFSTGGSAAVVASAPSHAAALAGRLLEAGNALMAKSLVSAASYVEGVSNRKTDLRPTEGNAKVNLHRSSMPLTSYTSPSSSSVEPASYCFFNDFKALAGNHFGDYPTPPPANSPASSPVFDSHFTAARTASNPPQTRERPEQQK